MVISAPRPRRRLNLRRPEVKRELSRASRPRRPRLQDRGYIQPRRTLRRLIVGKAQLPMAVARRVGRRPLEVRQGVGRSQGGRCGLGAVRAMGAGRVVRGRRARDLGATERPAPSCTKPWYSDIWAVTAQSVVESAYMANTFSFQRRLARTVTRDKYRNNQSVDLFCEE